MFRKHKIETNDKFKARMDDKIVNSYSEFDSTFRKRCEYNDAMQAGKYAVDENNNKILLGTPGATINEVEFVAGMWRVQNKFPYEIVNVRGRNFVLSEKLAYTEKTKFDFYAATPVGKNCYGYFMSEKPDFYVAKYETSAGVFMAYGQTIEQARAFLGIKLYDQYQDLIHSVLNGKISNREHK